MANTANWVFDPSEYEEKSFAIIPVGNYRARIADVNFKTFNSGNQGYEITLDISGQNSKVWYYLILNANDKKATNQRIGAFFDSFDISEKKLGDGKSWVGKVGAVRIKHEEHNGDMSAKVHYVIGSSKQGGLPAWVEPKISAKAENAAPVSGFTVDENDIPF